MEGVQDASSITSAGSAPNLSSPPPFLCKTYDMVDDPSTNLVVSWSKNSNSFVVWNVPEFARDLLPKYFKHNNFSSFVRQLNTYGFRKVDPDRWEFANEGFLRGHKHLLKNISRRKPAHVQSNHHQPQQPQIQSTSVGACVEVGKFGLEEEVEILKRDKNILMQELVRLRQQQQTTDNQLQTVGQRVQVMEQRQQQIMSFLAKAMQSPGFFAQFVQQQNESNRRVGGSSKKRRLPKQEEENSIGEYAAAAAAHSPDGQIIKYQPSMNEAARAMVRQIKEMNASSIFEPSRTDPDGYNVVDAGSSSTRASGVTLSEVTPTSGPSFPTHPSENQSSPTKAAAAAQYPEMNVLNSQNDDSILLDFTRMQGIEPENTVDIADVNFVGSVLDADISLDSFSPDPDADGLLDGIPKLPGINDVFWEQFLATSPLTGDTDEINSSMLEPKEHEFQLGLENGWNRSPHMDHLTAQMGLLAAKGGDVNNGIGVPIYREDDAFGFCAARRRPMQSFVGLE